MNSAKVPRTARAIPHRERLEGGVWGCLIGDACGVPYEFHAPDQIPPAAQIDLYPPVGFVRSHRGTPPGTWSDDGAQALCLLASLVACDRLDIEDLGRRLLAWYQEGYLAVDGRVFDVGVQTAYAIRRLGRGFHATHAAAADEKANGNGSLMRVLPLALWHQGDDAELVNDAHRQSLVTHGHLRAQVCCALYCLWARRTLEQAADPWAAAVASIRAVYGRAANGTAMLGELEFHVRPDDPSAGQGGGYVVDCLRSARWAVARGNYPRAIKAAISLGRDTDTTACVAGGIAGVRDGVLGIPKRWRQGIRGCELADPLVAALVARWSSK